MLVNVDQCGRSDNLGHKFGRIQNKIIIIRQNLKKKNTFPKEFFNEIWLKVGEHMNRFTLLKVQLKKILFQNGSQNIFFSDIAKRWGGFNLIFCIKRIVSISLTIRKNNGPKKRKQKL